MHVLSQGIASGQDAHGAQPLCFKYFAMKETYIARSFGTRRGWEEPVLCSLQVAVLYALLTAKGGVLSGEPAAGIGSGGASAESGSASGESGASSGDYWALRYAHLQQDVHTMQARMEAIAQEVADAMAGSRAECGGGQRG